jgi:cytochrome c oxidase assembly protein subunit 11
MSLNNPKNQTRKTLLFTAGFAVFMFGVAFAAVPLYDLLCRVTGLDGTPKITQNPSIAALTAQNRFITVRLDANVAPQLGWYFEAKDPIVKVRVGEPVTVAYTLKNTRSQPVTGIATYNISPPQMAGYFNKIQCFCFTNLTLKAGESTEVVVVFYIDPELTLNKDLAQMNEITLSYTFFESATQKTAEKKSDLPVSAQ